MEDVIERVRALLKQQYPGCELDIEPIAKGGRISGFLIWEGFVGQEHLDRQTHVWKVLRQHLTREDQLRIAAILTLTPEEMAAAREG